jgi:Protein of unknown function (DUF998)
MADIMTTAKSVTAISLTAARLTLVASAAFLVLLAVLHLIKPELDPSWHFISEYAIGDYGWIMTLAFLSLAFSCASLAVALWSQTNGIVGKIGLALLLISAAGMAIAGIFTTDPITTSRDAMTTSGQIHELGATLDLTPFAALLISWSLIRRNPAWSSARRAVLWTAGLPLFGLIVFIGSVSMLLPSNGEFGPNVLVGWPNRFLVVTYCIWLITVALQAIRLNSRES